MKSFKNIKSLKNIRKMSLEDLEFLDATATFDTLKACKALEASEACEADSEQTSKILIDNLRTDLWRLETQGVGSVVELKEKVRKTREALKPKEVLSFRKRVFRAFKLRLGLVG